MADFGVVALDGQREIDSYGAISQTGPHVQESIVWDGQLERGSYLGLSQAGSQYLRGVVCVGMAEHFMFLAQYTSLLQTARVRSGRDDVVGNPTPPSQKQGAPGILRHLLIPLSTGAHTISIDVLFTAPGAAQRPEPFPRMTVRANPDVGLLADVVAQAVDAETWQTLMASFSTTKPGVVEVWREKRCLGMDDTVWWDNLTVS